MRYTIALPGTPLIKKPARFALLVRDQNGGYVYHFRPSMDKRLRPWVREKVAMTVDLAKRDGHTVTICRVVPERLL